MPCEVLGSCATPHPRTLPHLSLLCPTLSHPQGPLGGAGRAEQGRAEWEAAGRHYHSQHRAGDQVKPDLLINSLGLVLKCTAWL